ncbi:histidine kinase dimerization/phosphoacceptor domain -containing protein [Gracilimonas sp. Q87]|uniref:histidine kinase dimerization/phosphoacceptor domain -containing protein n=1 Tax=Gracilimonas sp. Q87 TaxID=3384766 RepID=UPI003983E571
MINKLSEDSEIFKLLFYDSPTPQLVINSDFKVEQANSAFKVIFKNNKIKDIQFYDIFKNLISDKSSILSDGIYWSDSIENNNHLFKIIFNEYQENNTELYLAWIFPIRSTKPFIDSKLTGQTYMAVDNNAKILFLHDPENIFAQETNKQTSTLNDLFISQSYIENPWICFVQDGLRKGILKFKNTLDQTYHLKFNIVSFDKFGIHFFLLENETKLRSIEKGHEIMSITFDTMDTPIVCMDDNFNISYINRAGLELWQIRSFEEAIKTNIETYFTQKKRFKIIRKHLSKEHNWQGRLNGISFNNSQFDVLLNIKKIPVSPSFKYKWLVTLRRIDNELKREQKLKKFKNRYHQFFNSSPDAIFIVNKNGIIEKMNPSAEKMFGYKPFELIGEPVEILVPDRFKHSHISNRMAYYKNPTQRPMGSKMNFKAKRKDDTCIPVDIMLGPLEEDNQTKTYVAIRDTTKFLNAKNKIKDSLAEKENLLKEMHHRVKNNLAVVSGLLELQLYQEDDEKLVETLRNGINRIKSIALVHEQLYQLEEFASLKFDSYLQDFCKNLHQAHIYNQDIDIETDLDPIELSMEYAIPCALILNEIITNSLKHAFDKNRSGKIKVELKKINPTETNISLKVSDDGVGIPRKYISGSEESLGMTLIHILTKQIDGDITITNADGTVHTIYFNPDNPL